MPEKKRPLDVVLGTRAGRGDDQEWQMCSVHFNVWNCLLRHSLQEKKKRKKEKEKYTVPLKASQICRVVHLGLCVQVWQKASAHVRFSAQTHQRWLYRRDRERWLKKGYKTSSNSSVNCTTKQFVDNEETSNTATVQTKLPQSHFLS